MTTSTARPLIRIIVGSVRPVRIGDQIARDLAPLVADAADARVEIVDLADIALPLLNEPLMPALGTYAHDHTRDWSRIVSESDAIVFLTPQYNGGYPASLKNAIDYLFHEWKAKPALIVSYGGHGGGLSAAQLRGVLDFIGLDLVESAVELTIPRESVGEDWRLVSAAPIIAAHEDEIRTAGRELVRRVRTGAEAPVL